MQDYFEINEPSVPSKEDLKPRKPRKPKYRLCETCALYQECKADDAIRIVACERWKK